MSISSKEEVQIRIPHLNANHMLPPLRRMHFPFLPKIPVVFCRPNRFHSLVTSDFKCPSLGQDFSEDPLSPICPTPSMINPRVLVMVSLSKMLATINCLCPLKLLYGLQYIGETRGVAAWQLL